MPDVTADQLHHWINTQRNRRYLHLTPGELEAAATLINTGYHLRGVDIPRTGAQAAASAWAGPATALDRLDP